MGLGYTVTKGTGHVPVWQQNGAGPQAYQGGFGLVPPTGVETVAAGTPLLVDETSRTATPLGTAELHTTAGAAVTAYQVKKGHFLKVADEITDQVGGTVVAITAIDTSNADYDVLTVDETLGALAQDSLVFKSQDSLTGSLAGVNALLYETVPAESGTSCTAIHTGAIYARRVPYTADFETALPHITYSQSL